MILMGALAIVKAGTFGSVLVNAKTRLLVTAEKKERPFAACFGDVLRVIGCDFFHCFLRPPAALRIVICELARRAAEMYGIGLVV
jgi:hypothetical protein